MEEEVIDYSFIKHEETIDNIRFVWCDNEKFMDTVDMGYFHLAIVDPPYGISVGNMNLGRTKEQKEALKFNTGSWDNAVPPASYWKNLFRVSRNQIVWGANYFFEYLPNAECVIAWDKEQGEGLSFDDFELAWTSFKSKSRVLKRNRAKDAKHEKIHQTQKPVYLYRWLFMHYAQKGMRVLDTHGGSHNIAIAANEYGVHLTVLELDEGHHFDGIANYKKHTQQGKLIF